MASLIEIHSLSAGYESHIVLADIDFSIRENDFIGVIGPNGGGKTTLLKVILGLIKPECGNIIFNEALLRRNKIGYLPQMSAGDNSFPVTVMDVVLSGLMINKSVMARITSEDRKMAENVIGELGLSVIRKAPLNELSGGQLQRVFLGRAIIGSPALLLLDEPDNFVDATFENDFYQKLHDLNKRMAILLVSHDVGTISSHVKSFACVNRKLHYHPFPEITTEQLSSYDCPIQLVSHGRIPHTVLEKHD
ncbi:MAG: zinc ABC transporter ATP-binding protein [Odoribacter sp.]|nr:zinc ABC transporter ATP-binding protein [Odoribacter sp.]